eukprot:Plantae.Rhodophyta-Hildenbrandia_rubra.ctg18770.p1 GENE.Plantae.Rhodophyta-Hildenbrandia_rubra.ctg18770~~Plantae.Rhodophyta-Hildenbrandia_rubra.ctg18770.p1  ORF type:complete len:335 (-),score=48.33 Plantae.Rhodophyta-Hildenbrandia_rubra.ctg18770:15-1019(-)
MSGLPRVLIDCGALVMAGNENFARIWLEKAPIQDVDAAVYFDSKDRLMAITRSGLQTLFELSTFKDNMTRCIVYLDDSHSRGVDLSFAPGTKGIVTLGKGLTKDRLMQACMRLRLLGKDHSVSFLASREVNEEIISFSEAGKSGPMYSDVVSWSLQNSARKVENHIYRWGLQGENYLTQQVAAAQNTGEPSDLRKLAEESIVDEIIALEGLYGSVMTSRSVYTLVRRGLSQTLVEGDNSVCEARCLRLKETILSRLKRLASDIYRCGKDENDEHERELEHELEEQKEIELPLRKEARQPRLHPDVKNIATNAIFDQGSSAFLTIADVFKSSSLL